MVTDEQFPFFIFAVFLFFETKLDFSHEGGVGDGVGNGDGSACISSTSDIGKGEGIGMVEYVTMIGIEGGTSGAGLGPIDAPAACVEVAQCPVGHGNGETAWVKHIGYGWDHELIHRKCKGFAAVGDAFPPFLLGENLCDDRSEHGVGRGDVPRVDIAEAAQKRCYAG